MPRTERRLWNIVLAAGRGTRLASITTMIHGHPVPKQFATLLGDRSLLQATLDRIARLAPASRTVVVVDAAHARLAEQQLASYPGVRLVLQPCDRGTAAGLLLPLAEVLARDDRAQALVLPADHVIADEAAFQRACQRALTAAAQVRSGVALVGASATMAATDLGWIAPGQSCGRAAGRGFRVERFVEKPDLTEAQALLADGAMWNTLILAGRGQALWQMVAGKLPRVAAPLCQYRLAIDHPDARPLLDDAYDDMPPADLSRDVLEHVRGLAVVQMSGSGWTDCGTPRRLLEVLRRIPRGMSTVDAAGSRPRTAYGT
jgi:mannose-1-phosphate guanylyltransferase